MDSDSDACRLSQKYLMIMFPIQDVDSCPIGQILSALSGDNCTGHRPALVPNRQWLERHREDLGTPPR